MATSMTTRRTCDVVSDWLEKVIPDVKLRMPQSVHIDRLLDLSMVAPKQVVEVSVDAFQDLITGLGDRLVRYMPMLVVPLEDSDRMVAQAPKPNDIAAQLSSFESASLIIVDRETLKLREVCEEYRVPIIVDRVISNNMISCYYRTHRNENGILTNSEFARGIYFVCHPSDWL
jgi:hypothetical protein